MNYLEPWQMEGEEAIEIVVGTLRAAWTIHDDVYVHTGTREREDGYQLIGNLHWVEESWGGNAFDDLAYNEERLREFVLEWAKTNGIKMQFKHEEIKQ